jgi:D-sedoheptulose 7-phosphate isomerase
MTERVKNSLREAMDTLEKFMFRDENPEKIVAASNILVDAFKKKCKVISCGNGGSMCDAMHFAEELTGRFRQDRISLPAISVSDASHLTCAANDYGFDHIFSRYIEGVGQKGDVLLAISTSGNSENILNATIEAKKKGMKVISLTGKSGGKLAGLSDIEIRVPHNGYSDRIQEIHIKIIHILIQLIEEQMC